MIRSETWVRLFFSLLFLYLFGMGATFTGILTPDLQRFTLVLILVMVVMWLGIRWRAQWRWYRTPLDTVLVLWAIAFVVSLLANQDTWRRSLIGLWYVGVYVGTWYILYDAMANRVLKWEALVDGVMFGGLIVLVAGYLQVSKISFDLSNFELPRPGGTIGNPNSLGTFLIILLSLSTARFFDVRLHLARIVVGFYSLMTGTLLFLTFSRGAWIGGAAMASALALFVLHSRGLVSVRRLRAWWHNLPSRLKLSVMGAGVLAVVFISFTVFLLGQSVGASGRSPGLRWGIYENALKIIKEKPFTGHGLFTFGQELGRMQSQPPQFPHSHAHNIVLHIQAELGITGSAALLATVVVAGLGIRRAWRDVPDRDRMELAGVIAAAVGFGVHLLLDTTIMMPVIALMGLLVLVRSIMPDEPVLVAVRWRRLGTLMKITVIWTGLLGTGFWSANIYDEYFDALAYASPEEGPIDYRGAAERIQPPIDADPEMAIYHSQQAYLYGMAANTGDTEALPLAIAGFQRFLEMEPDHAAGWANLAALYWQDGQLLRAIDTMQHAQSLAWLSQQITFQLGRYAELAGQGDRARDWYRQALHASTRLWPGWDATPLSREIATEFTPSGEVALVLALNDPEQSLSSADVEDLWEASELDTEGSVRGAVLRILLIERSGVDGDTLALLERAGDLAEDYVDDAWVHLGLAAVARSLGDITTAEGEIVAARTLVEHDIGRGDTAFGGNIAVFQFLRLAYPRQFLPQIYYPVEDPALLHLLDAFHPTDRYLGQKDAG